MRETNSPSPRKLRRKPDHTPPHDSEFLTRAHAARFADCSEQLIDKYIRSGKLRRYGIGRRVLVSRAELLQVMKELR